MSRYIKPQTRRDLEVGNSGFTTGLQIRINKQHLKGLAELSQCYRLTRTATVNYILEMALEDFRALPKMVISKGPRIKGSRLGDSPFTLKRSAKP